MDTQIHTDPRHVVRNAVGKLDGDGECPYCLRDRVGFENTRLLGEWIDAFLRWADTFLDLTSRSQNLQA